MELRKDPITRSWVITGDDAAENTPRAEAFCRFCPETPAAPQVVSNMPGIDGGAWSARAVVHPTPMACGSVLPSGADGKPLCCA